MARKPRLHVEGGVYHVMLRGNGGQRVFHGRAYHESFYRLLAEGVGRFGHKIIAFCLMNNHVHLAVRVDQVPLSRILQNLAFRYTRWFNRKTDRSGHLFQGRYKAVLVTGDSQLLQLVRYIHLNPVRAKLVKDPKDWTWSGHRTYLGREDLTWLDARWVLRFFDRDDAAARRRYERFVLDGLSEGRREEFHVGGDDPRIVGDVPATAEFQKARGARAKRPPDLDRILAVVCTAMKVPEGALNHPGRGRRLSDARAVAALLAVSSGAATLTSVGSRFERDVSSMSSAVRRLTERMKASPSLRETIAAMGAELDIATLQA
jgi:putative transposase